MTWVLATRNRGKLAEISQILADAGMPEQVLDLDDIDVPDTRETGVTFAENALLKARAVVAQSGMPAMADDSGLAVDVLGERRGLLGQVVRASRGRRRQSRPAVEAVVRRGHGTPRSPVRVCGGGGVARRSRSRRAG